MLFSATKILFFSTTCKLFHNIIFYSLTLTTNKKIQHKILIHNEKETKNRYSFFAICHHKNTLFLQLHDILTTFLSWLIIIWSF